MSDEMKKKTLLEKIIKSEHCSESVNNFIEVFEVKDFLGEDTRPKCPKLKQQLSINYKIIICTYV